MEKRRVVITGLGTVNPLGNNTADSWAAAKAGKMCIRDSRCLRPSRSRRAVRQRAGWLHPDRSRWKALSCW